MEKLDDKSELHPHAYLYKLKESSKSQNERRIQFLNDQKKKRHDLADKNREASDLFLKQLEEFDKDEEMEFESIENRRSRHQFKLMMTEWFTDIPDDLEENWIIKWAPEGFRVLLVARNHHTSIYNNKGRFLFKIKTNFPGGGGKNENGTTVLDCICNKKLNVFFVLDCLFWNSMSTVNSEATFRFYWLTTKFQELPELSQHLKYKFILMECLPAEKSLIQEKIYDPLQLGDSQITYDGIVFYHKESEYTFGYTPLATWLASFMLPEKLGIDVPAVYLDRKPRDYVDLQHYIDNQALFLKMKRSSHRKQGLENMEV